MALKLAHDFLLMHLSDSAFPTGGFAYSAGLEAMIEFGLVTNEDELTEYIYEFARQAIAFDLPYINSFYQDWENKNKLVKAAQYYDTSFVASSMYEGSVNLGKNWLRLIESLQADADIEDIKLFLKKAALPAHLIFVLAVSLKNLGFKLDQVKLFHINSLIRDQVSAAIRLGMVGPIQGHSLQHFIYVNLAENLNLDSVPGYETARKTGVVPDLAQMLQKNVYSKLFKN